MKYRNTRNTYGLVSRCLHWLMAALILTVLFIGLTWGYYPGGLRAPALIIHKSFGVLILFFLTMRIGWRVFNSPPSLPDTIGKTMKLAAHLGHLGLYAFMLIMPLSGLLMVNSRGREVKLFNTISLPSLMEKNREWAPILRESHGIIAYCFLALIIVHVGAALYHRFVLKDNVLNSMLKGTSKK